MGRFDEAPNHLSGLLTLTARLVQDRLNEGLRPLGLSYAQAAALVRLWRSPDPLVLQRDLVNSLALSRATGTLLITDLEQLGLLTRRPDDVDGRRQVLELTRRGRALEQPVFDVIEQLQLEIASVIGDDAVATTMHSLTRLLGHLEPNAAPALPTADRDTARRVPEPQRP